MSHSHHSHTEPQNPLSFQEKMIKLLDHWINHNDDHSKTYIDWAEKAKLNNMDDTADILETVSQMTVEINKKLEQALKQLN